MRTYLLYVYLGNETSFKIFYENCGTVLIKLIRIHRFLKQNLFLLPSNTKSCISSIYGPWHAHVFWDKDADNTFTGKTIIFINAFYAHDTLLVR